MKVGTSESNGTIREYDCPDYKNPHISDEAAKSAWFTNNLEQTKEHIATCLATLDENAVLSICLSDTKNLSSGLRNLKIDPVPKP